MNLMDTIVEKLKLSNTKQIAILLDSQYVTHAGKMLYASLTVNSNLKTGVEFFIQTTDEDGKSSKKIVYDAFGTIYTKLVSPTLYNVTLNKLIDVDKCRIELCNSLNLLVLESVLYSTARQIYEKEQELGTQLDYSKIFVKVEEDNSLLDSDEIRQLVSAFSDYAKKNYRDLIYSSGSNRFIAKLRKSKRFYGIQKSFVPVFIDCSLIFNPMKDRMIQNTKMYKMAVETNRYIEIKQPDCTLSCYFLTHQEICEAFGMIHFMRFTPYFWLQIYFGLLYPSLNSYFPTKGDIRWVTSKAVAAKYGLKVQYSAMEMQNLIEKLDIMKKLNEPFKSRGIESSPEDITSALGTYAKRDALYSECLKNYNTLTTIGTFSIDSKENATVQSLYNYISEAQLNFA